MPPASAIASGSLRKRPLTASVWITRYVKVDESLYRPAEINQLLGDASKAKNMLGWQPQVWFPELVREMVEADLRYYSGLNDMKIW